MLRTVLVTGASGHIGRFLVPALLEAGYKVRAQYGTQPGSAAADWRPWNFLEEKDAGRLVEDCDAIVHLAAEIADQTRMQMVNVQATASLARAACAQGVRYFAYASSIVVYGSPSQRDIDENSPVVDPEQSIERQYRAEPYMREYARTKVLAEAELRKSGLACPIDLLRPSVIVDREQILAPARWGWAKRLLFSHRATQFVDVRDVAAAILHLLARGLLGRAIPIQAYNIVDHECGTYRDYFALDPRLAPFVMQASTAIDLVKDLVKYRSPRIRLPIGMLNISNCKLRATGFELPIGGRRALREALENRGS